MNLQGHRNDAGESRLGYLYVALPFVWLDSAGVWPSSQAIIWISVLAGLFRGFANQVTFNYSSIAMYSLGIIMYTL